LAGRGALTNASSANGLALRQTGLSLFNVDRHGVRMPYSPYHSCPALARAIAADKWRMVSDAFRQSVDRVRLWHACGRHKFETLPLCAGEGVRGGPAGDHAFCASRSLRLYQALYARANPCVAAGTSAGRCAARLGCKWCSARVRCIPKGWSCFGSDLATRALEERMSRPRGKSNIRPGWCSHQCDEACCAARTRKVGVNASQRRVGPRPPRGHTPVPGHRRGYCNITEAGVAGDCERGDKGSSRIRRATSLEDAAGQCRAICEGCRRCRFFSYSLRWRDCSWFSDCDLRALHDGQVLDVPGFFTAAR